MIDQKRIPIAPKLNRMTGNWKSKEGSTDTAAKVSKQFPIGQFSLSLHSGLSKALSTFDFEEWKPFTFVSVAF